MKSNMKSNMKNEEIKQVADKTLNKVVVYLTIHLRSILYTLRLNYKDGGKAEGTAALMVSEEVLLISSFLTTLLAEGAPQEIIFVTKTGEKIDLKNKETLNDNALADILLGNLKKPNHADQS